VQATAVDVLPLPGEEGIPF